MARVPAAPGESRIKVMGLLPKFALSITLALAVVMGIACLVQYALIKKLTDTVGQNTLRGAVRLTAQHLPFEQGDREAYIDPETKVESARVNYGHAYESEGWLYQWRVPGERYPEIQLLVPGSVDRSSRGLFGLIAGIFFLVILVGAGVAMWVSRQVAGPIEGLIEDIRRTSRGNLKTLGIKKGARELHLLVRSINRMTADLEAAQEAEFELSIRERELELASGVRDALLPVATPLVEGYDIGSSHLSSPRFGGDFHDYIELEDGRVGLLVCDVAGSGVPAALVGATARAYLRSHLLMGEDVAEALFQINRELAQDVRRGMFVTALYVLLDPREHVCEIACAGHKIPLIRYTAADGKMRLVHPEGIALAFDQGPVFERALQVERLTLQPGDRLVLTNSGPVEVRNPAGDELGEKPFYRQIYKHAQVDTGRFLKSLRRSLEDHADGETLPVDISLVTVQREA